MMKIRKLSTALMLSLAIGVAAPSAWAAADHPDETKQVAADQIPAAVQQTLQRAMPAGSTPTEYHRQTWGKEMVYAVDFTTPSGQKLKAHIRADGTLFEGPGLNKGITLAPVAAAPAATPAVAAPIPAGTPNAQQLAQQRAQLVQQEAQLQQQIATLNAQIQNDEQRYTQIKSIPAQAAEAQRLVQDRQAAVTQRDADQAQLTQIGQQIAQVNQQLAAMNGTAVPAAAGIPGSYTQEPAPGQEAGQWHYQGIDKSGVPAAAYQAMEHQLNSPGVSDVHYRKDTKGDQTAYTVHWLDNGKRYFMTVSPAGQVETQPRLSTYQQNAGGAAPVNTNTKTNTNNTGSNNKNGGVTYTTINEKDVNPVARSAIDTAFGNKDLKGSTNKVWQKSVRDGKTYYSVHFTHDGKRMEARWDENGKLVEGPSPARE